MQHAEQHTHMWAHPHPRVCARAPIALWGHSQHRDAPARCVRKPALAALCVLEKHKDAPHNRCLPCACFLYFSFVSWSRNHRLIPIKACKRLPLLDQTQKNSSRWLKHIYIPQVITSWHSPLYSFPRVKAEILVHFFFLSPIFFLFSRLPFFWRNKKAKGVIPMGPDICCSHSYWLKGDLGKEREQSGCSLLFFLFRGLPLCTLLGLQSTN